MNNSIETTFERSFSPFLFRRLAIDSFSMEKEEFDLVLRSENLQATALFLAIITSNELTSIFEDRTNTYIDFWQMHNRAVHLDRLKTEPFEVFQGFYKHFNHPVHLPKHKNEELQELIEMLTSASGLLVNEVAETIVFNESQIEFLSKSRVAFFNANFLKIKPWSVE